MQRCAIAARAKKCHQPPRPGAASPKSANLRRVPAHCLRIAARFAVQGEILQATPLGAGLINETFKIDTACGAFVLQRINSRVFPQPALLMSNLQQLNRHIRRLPPAAPALKIPELIPARGGKMYVEDEDRQCWRAMELIQPAESRERLSSHAEAAQVGAALAQFHRLCSTLPVTELHDTLPGFHITPHYFRQYRTLAEKPPVSASCELSAYCRSFIEHFQHGIHVLENARQQGQLPERVIHGDPKLNNFLFAPGSDAIVGLVDLDTVKPGLVHYDIGDCLRSCCHQEENNRFDSEICRTLLAGYLQEAGQFFTAGDYDFLYATIWLIPFELGLRFYSDYLDGDRYFKTSHAKQNLQRAVAQFQLCESIAGQRELLEEMIREMSCIKRQ